VIKPVDVVVGDKEGKKFEVKKISSQFSVLSSKLGIYDVGPETIRLYAKYIKQAQTLVWNGAMGYFEQKPYDVGTLSIARLVASRSKGKAFGIIGGGETLQAMDLVGMKEDVDLVSTGGGAMLEYLSGNKLPGIYALLKK
jgi:phosphoglycerate kinase